MDSRIKVKLTYSLSTDECVVYEIWINSASLDEARKEAMERFKSFVEKLSASQNLNPSKVKIEQS